MAFAARILENNRRGVDLMSQGDFQKSLLLFRRGLRRLLEKESSAKFTKKQKDTTPSPSLLVRSVSFQHMAPAMSKAESLQSSDQQAFSLFDRAFIIEASSEEAALLSSLVNIDRAVIIILYNMALAYQLLAMRNANNQENNCARSVRYYQMAMEVLGRHSEIDQSKIMFLAVANNLGTIYSSFFQSKQMQCCLEWMATVLENLYDSCEALADEYMFFHLNVMVLLGKEGVLAAPTA